MNIAEKLRAEVDKFSEDHAKFEGGNNAAGTRARKALQAIKVLAQEGRKEISEAKNSNDNADNSEAA